jgi:subtilisin family serine protease
MKNKRRPYAVFTIHLFISICLLAGLISCAPTPPTVPPTEPPPPNTTVCKSEDRQASYKASNGFFVDNQVIVTGPRQPVEEVVRNVAASRNLEFLLVEDCDLSYLNETTPPPDESAPLDPEEPQIPIIDDKESAAWPFESASPDEQAEIRSSLVIRLYEFQFPATPTPATPEEPEPPGIAEIISQINEQGNQLYVFADPNYLTGPEANPQACGEPYSGGGSGGGPYGEPGIPTVDISTEVMRQWALLSSPGINLPTPLPDEKDTSQPRGRGVRIGVFDTSPFGPRTDKRITPTPVPLTIPPEFPAKPTNLQLTGIDGMTVILDHQKALGYDVSDHGLFVAGLIHAVAPESEIYLIRALNDEGCGHVFMLTKAINDFVNLMLSSTGQKHLDKVILSLSLTVHRPSPQIRNEDPELWGKIQEEITNLRLAIGEAHNKGAIIVSASGNNSTLDQLEDMQIPATYDRAIGVAASNMEADRSCYSNRGDVAAPGGDGGEDLGTPCAPRSETWDAPPVPTATVAATATPQPGCTDMATCQYGLISLSLKTTGGTPGYIYWAGTSFSTPLVSGLAALALEKTGGIRRKAVCLVREGASTLTPASSTVRWGSIDVNNSLFSSSVLAQCRV